MGNTSAKKMQVYMNDPLPQRVSVQVKFSLFTPMSLLRHFSAAVQQMPCALSSDASLQVTPPP